MLKKLQHFFATVLVVLDLGVASVAWVAAYYLRFKSPLAGYLVSHGYFYDPTGGRDHMMVLPLILIATYFSFSALGLYQARRTNSAVAESFDVIKASLASFFVAVTLMVFVSHGDYSRMVLAPYFLLFTSGAILARAAGRQLLRRFRAKGANSSRAVIVGAGELAQDVAARIEANPWMGIDFVGFVASDDTEEVDPKRIVGTTGNIDHVIQHLKVDRVFCAMPNKSHVRLAGVLDKLTEEIVDVHIVPDVLQYASLNASMGDLDGVPLIHLRESPLYGWNRVFKRIFDVVCGVGLLVVFGPIMAAVAFAVKWTSPGPIFYAQERMTLDGQTFMMYKFRSMKIDAEDASGAVWCKKNDDRRTPIGEFIRKTSLDELPQFWNVVKGDMSLVGPRPERPVFIHKFKSEVPKYMLRHQVPAGVTGWAQINGWRGDTSLEKRIQYDLYYIENWSLWFDLRIMLLTPLKGFVNTNAY